MSLENVCGYKLLRELGTRALPAYAAVAPKVRRPEDAVCVVEQLTRDPGVNAEAVAVFMRDAKRLSQVRHPNLVHVRDVVVGTSTVLVVTNWVDGELFSDVTRMAAEKAMAVPLAGSLRVIVDLLEGLSALHEVCDAKRERLNLAHREVAPRNVVVGVDGRSVLVHPLRTPGAPAKEHPADVVGYLAPELLLADQSADQRADVYGAGVLLWEALAGRRMHADGEDTGAIVMRLLGGHVEAPTPPIDAPWALPLAEVAKKALAPDPGARFANATDMLAAVRRAIVARLAPKQTVATLVEAVAGDRIRARNTELGVVRPDLAARSAPSSRLGRESAWTSETPPPSVATPAPARAAPVHPHAPPVTPHAPPATPRAAPVAVRPPSLTNEDRTPLVTVDPMTGEERPVFRSDPPASADLIEVVELDIPVDKPSRPLNVRPPAPPTARKPGTARPPRPPPPLPHREAGDATADLVIAQLPTDMGSVARVSRTVRPPGGSTRWTIVAACALAVGLGLWVLVRPRAEPVASAPATAASASPSLADPAPLPAAAAPASPPAPPPVVSAPPPVPLAARPTTPPTNEPGPFDPSVTDDHRSTAHAATRPAGASAATPGASPLATPAQPATTPPASSTRGKKRVYDPTGI